MRFFLLLAVLQASELQKLVLVMEQASSYWVTKLALQPHPEGGFFREIYRSSENIPAGGLPPRFDGERSFSTAIYFLLENGAISALHRIKSDEAWHFYTGVPYHLFIIHNDGRRQEAVLGPDVEKGHTFQFVVPGGAWFGGKVMEKGFALLGCTVAPGFDFADFEIGQRDELLKEFPQHSRLIADLTCS